MDMISAPEKSQHIINISRYTKRSHNLPSFFWGKALVLGFVLSVINFVKIHLTTYTRAYS